MTAHAANPAILTSEQVAHFHREGYVIADDVFDDGVLRAIEEEFTAEIDSGAAEIVAKGELSQAYAEADFAHRLALISAETDKLALSMWDGHLCGPAIFNLIRYPGLLDIACQLCDTEELIASSVYRVRPKVPNNKNKSPVPWHQDSGYFEPYCDRSLVLTVWVPLVNATAENGCLWVKPRSHDGPVLKHIYPPDKPYLLIRDRDLPPVESVCAEVKRGGALFLTNLTPHASFENNSDIVRWSTDLRYQSAELPTNAAVTRLPGETLPDPIAGIPPACYPPEADFLVRSRRRPDEVLADPADFYRIRKNHLSKPVTHRWASEPE